MPPPLLHSQVMSQYCGVCTRRAKTHKVRSYKINEKFLDLIRKFANSEYYLDEDHPRVLCGSCYSILNLMGKHGQDNTTKRLPQLDYSSFKKSTRITNKSPKCQCKYCEVSRLSGGDYQSYCNQIRDKPGKPAEKVPMFNRSSPSVKKCPDCQTELRPGHGHNCNKTSRRENLLELVRQSSTGTKQKIAAGLLDDIAEDQNVDKRGGTVSLATKGPNKKTVSFGPTKESGVFSHQDLLRLKTRLGLSTDKTLELSAAIKQVMGRKAVESNLKQAIYDLNHTLDDFFSLENVNVTRKVGENITEEVRPLVYCNDVESLVSVLLLMREIDEDKHSLIMGIDDGQKVLKVMLAVTEKNTDTEQVTRSKGVCSSQFKLTSVNRLIILAIIPDCQENYENIKVCLQKLKLSGINILLSADIKVLLSVTGKSGAAGKFNCYLCDGTSPWEEGKYKLLSFGDLRHNYQNFVNDGAEKSQAKKYGNCVREPLFGFPDDQLIIDNTAIPELHITIGLPSKMIVYIEKVAGEDFIFNFLTREGIKRAERRYGSTFQGNQASKLLKVISRLRKDAKKLPLHVAVQVFSVIRAMEMFQQVQQSCFGNVLCAGYEDKIKMFCQQYRILPMATLPPKFHCTETHIVDFLERHGDGKTGLGVWSEQAMESCHHLFNVEWEKVKVAPDHPSYGERLLTLVCRINSSHI